MGIDNYNQFCAPLERTPSVVLDAQVRALSNEEVLNEISDSFPDVFMILNQGREVVFANMNTLELVDAHSINDIKGQRPGEIFNCSYAWDRPSGCGTWCGTWTSTRTTREMKNAKFCPSRQKFRTVVLL